LAVGVVAAGAFVAVERRSPAPILDLSLLRRGGFALANALNLAANASWFVVLLLVPYYLLTVRGLGTVAGGTALAATPVGMALAAPAAGRLAGRIPLGPLCAGGLAVEAAGLAAVSRLTPSAPMVVVLVALAVVGAGVGLFQVPNQSFVMGSIPRSAQGVAGGITQTTRTVGVLLGVAGAGTLFEARTAAYDPPLAIAGDPSAVADGRFMAAFRDVFLAAALTAAAAALVALLRRDVPVKAAPAEVNSPGRGTAEA
jgi:MFS family permease